MPENNDAVSQEDRLKRLHSLTKKGKLEWTPLYGDPLGVDVIEGPDMFALIDYEHGFGRIQLVPEDVMNESDRPILNVNGEIFTEVDESDLRVLLDAVQTHLQDLQSGSASTISDRIEQAAGRIAMPFAAESDKMHEIVHGVSDIARRSNKLAMNLTNVLGMQAQVMMRQLENQEAMTMSSPEYIPVAGIDQTSFLCCVAAFAKVVWKQDYSHEQLINNYGQEDLNQMIEFAAENLGQALR